MIAIIRLRNDRATNNATPRVRSTSQDPSERTNSGATTAQAVGSSDTEMSSLTPPSGSDDHIEDRTHSNNLNAAPNHEHTRSTPHLAFTETETQRIGTTDRMFINGHAVEVRESNLRSGSLGEDSEGSRAFHEDHEEREAYMYCKRNKDATQFAPRQDPEPPLAAAQINSLLQMPADNLMVLPEMAMKWKYKRIEDGSSPPWRPFAAAGPSTIESEDGKRRSGRTANTTSAATIAAPAQPNSSSQASSSSNVGQGGNAETARTTRGGRVIQRPRKFEGDDPYEKPEEAGKGKGKGRLSPKKALSGVAGTSQEIHGATTRKPAAQANVDEMDGPSAPNSRLPRTSNFALPGAGRPNERLHGERPVETRRERITLNRGACQQLLSLSHQSQSQWRPHISGRIREYGPPEPLRLYQPPSPVTSTSRPASGGINSGLPPVRHRGSVASSHLPTPTPSPPLAQPPFRPQQSQSQNARQGQQALTHVTCQRCGTQSQDAECPHCSPQEASLPSSHDAQVPQADESPAEHNGARSVCRGCRKSIYSHNGKCSHCSQNSTVSQED